METVRRENLVYVKAVTNLVYKKADKKKLSKDYFYKELKSAVFYGALNACQMILNEQRKKAYASQEEIIGDLQEIMMDAYKTMKKDFQIRIPDFSLEECIRLTEGKENDST